MKRASGPLRVACVTCKLVVVIVAAVVCGCSSSKRDGSAALDERRATHLAEGEPRPPSTPTDTARPGGTLPGDPVAIQLVEVAGGFVDPIHVASPRDGTGRLFVCERPGI